MEKYIQSGKQAQKLTSQCYSAGMADGQADDGKNNQA